MDINRYLDRIQYKGKTTPEIEVLNDLQIHHLLNIPFENLDIHYGNHIILDLDKIYEKIVVKKRGGFCYELNGLFFELLKKLGFNARIISARVYDNRKSSYGEEFDHLAIIVTINQKEYLADAGFGELVFKPLKLEPYKPQKDIRGNFVIENYKNGYYRILKLIGSEKFPEYIFTKKPRCLEEFEDMCQYHQKNPNSHFTQKRLISKPSINGRVTISGDSLKITEEEKVVFQKKIYNEGEFADYLLKYFNINEKEIKPLTPDSS